jgi:hypothetical protein
MNITDKQGSRVCLMNTSINSLCSGLACASNGVDIAVPEKGISSEALHAWWMLGEALIAAD